MCDQYRLRLACAYAQSDQSLVSVNIMLLTENHLEFLSLKRGCTGVSEYIHVKMPHCWKSHVAAHMFFYSLYTTLTLDRNANTLFEFKHAILRSACLKKN